MFYIFYGDHVAIYHSWPPYIKWVENIQLSCSHCISWMFPDWYLSTARLSGPPASHQWVWRQWSKITSRYLAKTGSLIASVTEEVGHCEQQYAGIDVVRNPVTCHVSVYAVMLTPEQSPGQWVVYVYGYICESHWTYATATHQSIEEAVATWERCPSTAWYASNSPRQLRVSEIRIHWLRMSQKMSCLESHVVSDTTVSR